MTQRRIPIYVHDLSLECRLHLIEQLKQHFYEERMRDLRADGADEEGQPTFEEMERELSEDADDYLNRNSNVGFVDLP